MKKFKRIKLPLDKKAEEKHKKWGEQLYLQRNYVHPTEPTWVWDESSVWSFYNERK